MTLAPILLFVYNRPWHTWQTVESLQKNILADESELFIFSDGAKNESDRIKVEEVRNYIRRIKGFKRIDIEESEENNGLAESVISGVIKVINQYGKVIVLEDDLISAPGFLKFMNEALDFYENQKQIFSVTGYSFPLQSLEKYPNDVYVLRRPSTWGWGTWNDRWEKVDWNIEDYNDFISNINAQRKFNEGGDDLTPMLKLQMNGYIDSWGVRWAYSHYKNSAYCLYSKNALVRNIGLDNSGRHSPKTNKFNVKIDDSNSQISLTETLKMDEEIQKNLKSFFKQSIYRKFVNEIKLRTKK